MKHLKSAKLNVLLWSTFRIIEDLRKKANILSVSPFLFCLFFFVNVGLGFKEGIIKEGKDGTK